MSEDDIAALLAGFDQSGEDIAADDSAEGSDTMNESDIEALLNGALSADGPSLDEGFVPEKDENLSEIEDLLSMSDNHEMVDNGDNTPFDIFAEDRGEGELAVDELDIDQLLSDSARSKDSEEGEAEEAEEGEEKPKKAKKAKKPKKKKKKSGDELEPDETEAEGEAKAGGFKNLIKRIIEALTEEADDPEAPENIPEKAAGEENMAILGELDAEAAEGGKKKKKKKEKKDKKDDPKAKAKEEAAKQKKEEAAKAKAAKAAAKKAAKEAKAAKKAEKEAALGPIKRLPKKKVIMIFVTFMPIMAALLVIGLLVPADNQKREARRAYADGDYDTAYIDLYGMELGGDDLVMFNNAKCVLQVRRFERAYENYTRLDMPREALDALIRGVQSYDYVITNFDTTYVRSDVDASYNNIIGILASKYGVNAELARKIIDSPTDYDYTRYIDDILAGKIKSDIPAQTSDIGGTAGDQDAGDGLYGGSGDTPVMPGTGSEPQGEPILQETVDSFGNVIPGGGTPDNGYTDDALIFQLYSQ